MNPGEGDPPPAPGSIHRIGGGSVENLRMKPAEASLIPPGISVLKGGTPLDAARQVRGAFPAATRLRDSSRIVGTSSEGAIRAAGFDVVPDPTRKFPNHHRLIHPGGVDGFRDESLRRLSEAFEDTPTEESS